ncbi:hypothetical protein GCM10009107_05140 [Ideonella azotifigens]|uniref:Uncharacterized protein n=1 Tax=Ideonella azotifigens TaxID=513160 RepID=A0ABP3UVL5_9BURK
MRGWRGADSGENELRKSSAINATESIVQIDLQQAITRPAARIGCTLKSGPGQQLWLDQCQQVRVPVVAVAVDAWIKAPGRKGGR